MCNKITISNTGPLAACDVFCLLYHISELQPINYNSQLYDCCSNDDSNRDHKFIAMLTRAPMLLFHKVLMISHIN